MAGFEWQVVLATVVVVFAAGVIQSITGFGFALLAVPLLSLVMAPSIAVVLVFLLGGCSSLLTLAANHAAISWRAARRLSIGAVLGMPVGALLLVDAPVSALRLILGCSTCAAAAWMLHPASKPHAASDRAWLAGLAGFVSGILNTALATNGPPLVAYLRTRQLPAPSFRSTLSVVFTISNVVGLVLLVGVGAVHHGAVDLAALSLLPGLLGWGVGHAVSPKIPAHHFDRSVDLLLLASGVLALGKVLLG